jgi:hypothetical protein
MFKRSINLKIIALEQDLKSFQGRLIGEPSSSFRYARLDLAKSWTKLKIELLKVFL